MKVFILTTELNYKVSYFAAIWYAWRLRKYAKECDFIHSFAEQYSYIAYWLAKLTDKKFFVTAHGTWAVLPFSLSFHKRYFHRKSFEKAAKIICVSRYTERRLVEFGLNNLHVINNGINTKKFIRPSITPWQERQNLIVSVGNLKRRKGYHISIPAFAKTRARFKDLRYYIVGDQSDRAYFDQLKRLCFELGVRESVDFVQHISDDELIAIYKKARLLVLSSISEKSHFEGFGLVYLEANASGLPVIGSLESGAEDAIRDGRTGFLVSQNDSEGIAEAIIKILGNKNLAETMSSEAIKWASEHDMDKVIMKYKGIYASSVINKPNK
ncbi:MAG: Glycosyl transferase group 1 [Microgenomates group bacterium GW2011_GWC1_39_7]|nr:MAG: Glycosyl transferase group 1 [Microgenomates group bacterium GW2011_GWC1_39_7]